MRPQSRRYWDDFPTNSSLACDSQAIQNAASQFVLHHQAANIEFRSLLEIRLKRQDSLQGVSCFGVAAQLTER